MPLLRAQQGTFSYTNGPSENYRPSVYGFEEGNHGGHCCGIKHLYGFPDCSEEYDITDTEKSKWLAEAINRCIDRFSDFEDSGHDYSTWRGGIEVVLAEQQLSAWCRTLEEAGFKQVFSFLNHNSGNECHVFFLETNRPKGA